MSPTQVLDHRRHAKKESLCLPPLEVSKYSHLIKKSSSSSSLSTASTSSLDVSGGAGKPLKQQRRRPVIIYTHSPKVIQTHPKDFMALVQKLTGFSANEDDHHNHRHHTAHQSKRQNGAAAPSAEEDDERINNNNKNYEGQVSSCFLPPPAPFLTNIPVFTPHSLFFA